MSSFDSPECVIDQRLRRRRSGPPVDLDTYLRDKGLFEKISDIGTGSFGKASLVRSLKDGTVSVMKIVDISCMNCREQKNALNEVRILSSLDHPYIIRYRGSFLAPGLRLCILMDFAAGGDLYRMICSARKQGRRFSERQLVRWFTQAALALRYLHKKHILHRDLKSQNVFLNRNGSLSLGDFGVAKVLEATSAFTSTQIGTPFFFSPEVCNNLPYSWASDIWALGCVMYEAASLSVPFHASNISSLLEKITQTAPPPLPKIYSEAFSNLVLRCLERDPAKRPSASQLLKSELLREGLEYLVREHSEKVMTLERVSSGSSSQPEMLARNSNNNSSQETSDTIIERKISSPKATIVRNALAAHATLRTSKRPKRVTRLHRLVARLRILI